MNKHRLLELAAAMSKMLPGYATEHDIVIATANITGKNPPLLLHDKHKNMECEACRGDTTTVMYLQKKDIGYVPACKPCRDEFRAKWCKDPDSPTYREWDRFGWNKERGYSR